VLGGPAVLGCGARPPVFVHALRWGGAPKKKKKNASRIEIDRLSHVCSAMPLRQ